MGRIVLKVAGYFFLVLGVIGLVLPVLQGVLFVLIGLLLLSRSTDWAPRWLGWIKSRHPQADNLVNRAETFAQGFEDRFRAWVGR